MRSDIAIMIGEHAVVQFVTERDVKHSVAPRETRVVVIFIGWLDVGMEFRGKLFALFGNPLVFDDAFSTSGPRNTTKSCSAFISAVAMTPLAWR